MACSSPSHFPVVQPRPPRTTSLQPWSTPISTSASLSFQSHSRTRSMISSSSSATSSSSTKVASVPDAVRLDFFGHSSGGLGLMDPITERCTFIIRPGVEGDAWSRVLYNVPQQGDIGVAADGVSFVGSVGEKGIWLRGREAAFKTLYKAKFYSSKVTFTGSDGRSYRWELGSSWKGDNLHLVDTVTSRTVLQLLRPNRGPHSLILTPQTVPMQEFLILATLQRVWALGLAGPEGSFDALAKLAAKADAEEYTLW